MINTQIEILFDKCSMTPEEKEMWDALWSYDFATIKDVHECFIGLNTKVDFSEKDLSYIKYNMSKELLRYIIDKSKEEKRDGDPNTPTS